MGLEQIRNNITSLNRAQYFTILLKKLDKRGPKTTMLFPREEK